MKAKFLQPHVNTVGLIAHWKLYEGTAFDYSLNGHQGIVTGTAPTFQYPGIDLPGTDEHITVADADAFSPVSTPLSISAWLNMTDATNFIVISKYVAGDTTREWAFYTQAADKLLYQIYDEQQDKFIAGFYDSALTGYQGTWIHVVGVWNGNLVVPTFADISLYLNGESVAVTDASEAGFVSCRNTNAIVDIGHLEGSFSIGRIDDLMIFNTEKSAADIKSIYEVTRGRYGA